MQRSDLTTRAIDDLARAPIPAVPALVDASATAAPAAPEEDTLAQIIVGKATKILHSQGFAICIVRFNGILIVIRGNQVNFLQASDRSTSENLVAMLKRQEIGTVCREKFTAKLRLAVTDGASYNKKTERCIVAKRIDWSCLLFLCEVHILSGIFTKTHELSKTRISGMLAWTLSITHGTEMQLWVVA